MNCFNKIKKTILATLLLALFFIEIKAQLYNVPLNQRLDNSTAIIEGKVIDKKSFWDAKHYNIYTSNIIEVYKVFKGISAPSQIEIITQGGMVGDKMDKVTHSLQLEIGNIGIFTCIPNKITKGDNSINKGYESFRVYAEEQGFFRYDLNTMKASDVFNVYDDVSTKLYPLITNFTKKQYTVIKKVDLYESKNRK